MGKKKGMTQVFDKNGDVVVCTVIHAEPNVVAQILTKEKAGYSAIQLAAFKASAAKKKNVAKPQRDQLAKKNLEPYRKMKESRVEDVSSYSEGQEIGVEHFSDCAFVDVAGVSKGKGYQGVMKRHNFAGGPAAHGSGFHRHGGSTGMRSSPGRTFLNTKMPGHMGNEKVTAEGLAIVKIDLDKNVLLVKGSVPGHKNGLVFIRKSLKKQSKAN